MQAKDNAVIDNQWLLTIDNRKKITESKNLSWR